MKDIKISQMAKRKKESREITSEIIKFGVKEDQKIDIMFNLAITLEDNEAMKEITKVLKKFRQKINKDEETDNIVKKNNKILT